MDIDLLSKMVKEIILDQDRVILPGLGSFFAEIVPATFSDKGYTINPPYRRLFFRQKPDEGGDLITLYAESNKIAPDMSEKILKDFLAELRIILHEKKTVVFPGLGRLRATKENNLFFVADENLDIYPEGFGLEPISLKTHQETPEQVTAAVEELKSLVVEVAEEQETPAEQKEAVIEPMVGIVEEPEPALEPEPEAMKEEILDVELEIMETEPEMTPEPEVVKVAEVETEPVPVQEAKPEPADVKVKSPWKTVLKVLIWLMLIALVLLLAFVVIGHVRPELVDRFLYTPEELEILNLN